MVQINWIEREGSRKYLPFHLHQLQHYPFFRYIHILYTQIHCWMETLFSFCCVFIYVSQRRRRDEKSVVYRLLHTKNVQFCFSRCQANNSISNMQSRILIWIFAFFTCINMAGIAYVCETHQVMFNFYSLSHNTICDLLFLNGTKNNMVHSFWLMYDLCLFSLTNDKSFQNMVVLKLSIYETKRKENKNKKRMIKCH